MVNLEVSSLGKELSLTGLHNLALDVAEKFSGETVDTWIMRAEDSPPSVGDINRVAGNPLGVGPHNWPRRDGKRMFHVLTLDLTETPGLLKQFPKGTRAVSVFIVDYVLHDADFPRSDEQLYFHSYAGGLPIWTRSHYVDGRPYEGTFILLFDVFLVDMNLGDSRNFLAFKEAAFIN